MVDHTTRQTPIPTGPADDAGGGASSGSATARILVVDDEAPIRQFVARALTHAGGHYQVETAEDGLEALGVLSRDRFDVLVTDIVMPGLDGIELALKVAKDYPHMTILMMTGYAAEKQRAYGLDHLIHKVVTKPFSLKQICAAVKEALAARGKP
ncbi:MAG: response regulator [Alphaproteobacteria bacterium]|jgi:CheY-like chemotaxis protein|nr:response regulator [Alphaproteobacteria bacterium]